MSAAHPLSCPRGLGALALSTFPPEPAASRITALRDGLAVVVGCSRRLLEQPHDSPEQHRLLSRLHHELVHLDRLAQEADRT